MKVKVEQIDLFGHAPSKPRKDGRCCVCHRPIKSGTMGAGCFRKTMKMIRDNIAAIEKHKRALEEHE